MIYNKLAPYHVHGSFSPEAQKNPKVYRLVHLVLDMFLTEILLFWMRKMEIASLDAAYKLSLQEIKVFFLQLAVQQEFKGNIAQYFQEHLQQANQTIFTI